ncbi:MAG TPA: response regulator transcription factor [Burkholderiales bacterium]
MREPPPPDLERVYVLTYKGEQQLKGAPTDLPESALRLLVLIDGKIPLTKLAKHLQGVSRADFEKIASGLILENYIKPAALERPGQAAGEDNFGAIDFYSGEESKAASGEDQKEQDFARSLEEAHNVSVALKRQGYYVNIARRPAQKALPIQGDAYSVLVVEDNASFASITRQFLTFEGFVPRMAANRDEVVNELRKPPVPDLMLLDIVLPDADGFEILTLVRKHAALNRLPVIVLTGKATREDVMHGLALGANGYVTKPFEFEALIASIRSVLGLDLDEDKPEK